MNSLNINNEGYSTPNGADVENNWAAAFAKRVTGDHKSSPVLDHPDGSVTENKLSPDVRETIADAKGKSETAKETADNAKVIAQSAKETADNASKESENAYEKSLDAYEKSQVAENIATGAKNKAESAEQRSVSAEAKADAAAVSAGVAIEKADAAMKEAGDALAYGINFLDARINEVDYKTDNHTHDEYITGGDASQMDYYVYQLCLDEIYLKADKTTITSYATVSTAEFIMSWMYNRELRLKTVDAVSIEFTDDVYQEDYVAGLSFNSGATPTRLDYTTSRIINWVGTDCTTFSYQINPEGDIATISLFIPSPNTHYDIVFYYNGNQFIGLVNGFVPATGNVVSE